MILLIHGNWVWVAFCRLQGAFFKDFPQEFHPKMHYTVYVHESRLLVRKEMKISLCGLLLLEITFGIPVVTVVEMLTISKYVRFPSF
jgi:hypothetical protein